MLYVHDALYVHADFGVVAHDPELAGPLDALTESCVLPSPIALLCSALHYLVSFFSFHAPLRQSLLLLDRLAYALHLSFGRRTQPAHRLNKTLCNRS